MRTPCQFAAGRVRFRGFLCGYGAIGLLLPAPADGAVI